MSNVLETKKAKLLRIAETYVYIKRNKQIRVEISHADFMFLLQEAENTDSYRSQAAHLEYRLQSNNEDLMATLKHLQAENKYLKNELKKKSQD